MSEGWESKGMEGFRVKMHAMRIVKIEIALDYLQLPKDLNYTLRGGCVRVI